MQKLLWLGKKYFAQELAQCGWDTVKVMETSQLGHAGWRKLVELAGFTPDVVVAADMEPFCLADVERFPCLLIYYSTQSARNPWQAVLAQAFDACCIAQAGHMGKFCGPFLSESRIRWLPLYARTEWNGRICHESAKTGFGVFDSQGQLPQELPFWQRLRQLAPPVAEQPARGRIMVQHLEYEETDCGIFELMAAGACVVTPRVGQGLEKLFVDGEHYVGYAREDAGDAAYRLNFLRANPDLAEYIGERAALEINAAHRAVHRAAAFTDFACDLVLGGMEGLIGARLEREQAMACYLRENLPQVVL